MIETKYALEAVDEIAAVPGVEAPLVGSNDLGQELGCLGQWAGDVFLGALRKVSDACKKHGRIFAIAGLYHRPDIMEIVVNDMVARWVLGGLDAGLLTAASKQNCDVLAGLQKCSSCLYPVVVASSIRSAKRNVEEIQNKMIWRWLVVTVKSRIGEGRGSG